MTRWLLFCLGLTVAALAGSLYVWHADLLPERFAIHWNIDGEADRWATRDEGLYWLLLPPGLMLLGTALAFVLRWMSPRPFDVEKFRGTWFYVLGAIVALFGYIHLTLLLSYTIQGFDGIRMLVGGLFLFFAVIGNVMGKVRRNLWMGVRTPWTLASDRVWIDTHRHAAWLWTATGLVGALAVFLGVPMLWCFVLLIAAALWPCVYSYIHYRRLDKAGLLEGPTDQAKMAG